MTADEIVHVCREERGRARDEGCWRGHYIYVREKKRKHHIGKGDIN